MNPAPLLAFLNWSSFMSGLSSLSRNLALPIRDSTPGWTKFHSLPVLGCETQSVGGDNMTATMHRAGIAGRENGVPPPDIPLTDIDLGALEFWQRDDDFRDGAFATLRRESPFTFFDVPEVGGFPAGAGHWALTRLDDIHHASRHPEIFSSIPTSTALVEVPAEMAEFAGSMISLDDPRHLRLRKIVNRA